MTDSDKNAGQITLSRQQVRDFDSFAINTLKIPGVVLMENAGRGCTDVLCAIIESDYPNAQKIAILAGKGNNAGDGFVIARHLLLRGFEVKTFLTAEAEKISGDARINLDILYKIGADITDASDFDSNKLESAFVQYDFLVDALGGTGISGKLKGQLQQAVKAANSSQVPILSVDIPTGIDCDSFDYACGAIRAAATVTFVASKPAFLPPDCAEFTGAVYLADIGIAPQMFEGK